MKMNNMILRIMMTRYLDRRSPYTHNVFFARITTQQFCIHITQLLFSHLAISFFSPFSNHLVHCLRKFLILKKKRAHLVHVNLMPQVIAIVLGYIDCNGSHENINLEKLHRLLAPCWAVTRSNTYSW